ncbi:DUF4123 domain-containing protein [Agrobacterium tumefaciens]|uniref:DUF4123 domain-containing protein n=1 Tax=Agrobacterium tumefaciens TaxID=358 RepID=UPI000FB14D46|nr:DUF4123 domain-containing protein [Agrobacterium tumefaciens]NSX92772.1 DUF4123 domain-containing protein [Agrobacterium tumefaciens]NTE58813.1 DUF4123 domain-containing protein [Agrobacterium tumefaciens]NTE73245.1 DUF4123 domain-containing protein [Agrobacterium tumefaciens]
MDYDFPNGEIDRSQPHQAGTRGAQDLDKLCQQLIDAGRPTFVVLDGAKFSDLPNALLRNRLLNRPLYVDRGGQIRDFDLTSPQMIYLDRSRDDGPENGDGPCKPRILSAVSELMEDCSAGVFWSCSNGGDTLFRHLRKINRVRVEAGHLPATHETHVDGSQDDILLFRHADANVMAQILPVLPERERERLMGPAEEINFVPDVVWSIGHSHHFTSINPRRSAPSGGMLRFNGTIMDAIETRRSVGVIRYLIVACSAHLEKFGQDYKELIIAAYHRGVNYGLETLEDLETFALTECEYGPRFELRPGHEEAEYMLARSSKSPAERVYYARRACVDAASHLEMQR